MTRLDAACPDYVPAWLAVPTEGDRGRMVRSEVWWRSPGISTRMPVAATDLAGLLRDAAGPLELEERPGDPCTRRAFLSPVRRAGGWLVQISESAPGPVEQVHRIGARPGGARATLPAAPYWARPAFLSTECLLTRREAAAIAAWWLSVGVLPPPLLMRSAFLAEKPAP